jgi:predicted GNAT family acetyltransferase
MIEFILRRDENRIIFAHTEVPQAFSGKGIASKMAWTAFEFAKKEGLKITSLCSYIDTWMKRHPEYDYLYYKR